MIEEEVVKFLSESKVDFQTRTVTDSISAHLEENFGDLSGSDLIATISRPGIDPIQLKRETIKGGRKIQTILVPIQVMLPKS